MYLSTGNRRRHSHQLPGVACSSLGITTEMASPLEELAALEDRVYGRGRQPTAPEPHAALSSSYCGSTAAMPTTASCTWDAWAVVGDTFPVGCRVQDSVVLRDSTFHDNPDVKNPMYNSMYGIYQPNCGLENILMSWGHDEYMYKVMKRNNFALPQEAFYMIRFHSFYPWHTGGDYMHLCDEGDLHMLPWVKEFNKFDLYTKCEDVPDPQELQTYYQGLIDKYCPGKLRW